MFRAIIRSRIFNKSRTVNLKIMASFTASSETKVNKWLEVDGEHDYLKVVEGDSAISWVKSQNEVCLKHIGSSTESPLYNKILSILDSKEKIPHVRKIDDFYYNFWQDNLNARGLWRRATMSSYKQTNPEWETVLDIDQLCKDEGESWVYKGHTLYHNSVTDKTSGKLHNRTLLKLSKGGSDAVVVREFDLLTKSFVSEEQGGFVLPPAKSNVYWKSINLLLVGTDLHDGTSMTDSGYPRVVREWRRGTPLSASEVVYEGDASDVSVTGYMCRHRDFEYEMRHRSLTFYTSLKSIRVQGGGEWRVLNLPADTEVGQFADQLLVSLRSDWVTGGSGDVQTVHKQGTLLAVGVADFLANEAQSTFTCLFAPTAQSSLETYAVTRDFVLLETLDCVKSRYVFWQHGQDGWRLAGQETEAVIRGSSVSAVDSDESNQYWLSDSSFLTPTALRLGDASLGAEGIKSAESLKSLPAVFDASELVERQYIATSADGTQVPYFLLAHRDMPLDGSTPTLLYGYGGFEVSLTPAYSAVIGSTWLDRATNGHFSCYVSANIRGGGEFGPSWHQAALRENRNLAYDDFIAVAEDLIARGITRPSRLGIRGGSNGGLLMGNMMVRRPDLFGAVACAVPLLDMRCYHKLLAGASWMAEYGDPDKPEDWAFLQRYSAYHNIDSEAVLAGLYPPLLMTTSTKDDRVHPYHARSFVKRLLEATPECAEEEGGNGRVFYYENMEGGHGGAADNKQQAFMSVLYLDFLKKTICPKL